MQYLQYAQNVLKNNVYRITQPRLLVIEVLAKTTIPKNAYDIAAEVSSQGEKVDVSTVYRILEVYRKLGLVHFVKQSQGYMPCEDFVCEEKKHCHHQFVCKNCDAAWELHFDDLDFFKDLKKEFKQFAIDEHYLELSGLCETCR